MAFLGLTSRQVGSQLIWAAQDTVHYSWGLMQLLPCCRWKDIFEEIPIKVHNTALSSALLAEIEPPTLAKQIDFDKLNLSVAPALEKNLEFVNDCLDDAVSEQQKVSMYHRSVARQQQQQAQWLQKRRLAVGFEYLWGCLLGIGWA